MPIILVLCALLIAAIPAYVGGIIVAGFTGNSYLAGFVGLVVLSAMLVAMQKGGPNPAMRRTTSTQTDLFEIGDELFFVQGNGTVVGDGFYIGHAPGNAVVVVLAKPGVRAMGFDAAARATLTEHSLLYSAAMIPFMDLTIAERGCGHGRTVSLTWRLLVTSIAIRLTILAILNRPSHITCRIGRINL